MKKLVLLFVVIVLALGSAGCLGKAKNIGNNKPWCPEWAANQLGTERCESLSLDITPDDIVFLVNWQVGLVQLNDSYIDNVGGVEFFRPDGIQIEPRDMEQGIFYSFRKTGYSSAFHIWPNPNHNTFSPDTHVLLAKP